LLEVFKRGETGVAGSLLLQRRDNPATFRFAHPWQILTRDSHLPFSALNVKSTGQPWWGGTLSRNHRSWSAASSGEELSRSSTGNSRNGSPKILLTASRVRFERSVTVGFRCDEDHILRKIAVHVPVPGGTTA
jgi:hypothetical protein